MALLPRRRRGTPEPAVVRAVYARVLDGETLWLAVSGATSVQLGSHPVGTEVDGDLLTARVPLAGLGDDLPLTADGVPLPAADGVLDEGPMRTPPTRDGRGQYAVVDPAALRVTRTDRPAEVLFLDATLDATLGDAELVVRLDVPDGVLTLADDGSPVAEVPVTDGVARLAADLVPDRPGVTLTLSVADRPVRRAANALRFPGAAVVLPGLDDGEQVSPYLRWLRDGRLALARPEATESDG